MNRLLAQSTEIGNPVLGTMGNLTGLIFFQKFIPALIGLAFVVGTLIFFFILVLGAIQWITAGGDKQALEEAKGKITNAMIGIVILFSLYALIDLVHIFFNITILTLDIAPLVIQ